MLTLLEKNISFTARPLPVYWIIGMLISKTQAAQPRRQLVCFCCLEKKWDEWRVGDYSRVGVILINSNNKGLCKIKHTGL